MISEYEAKRKAINIKYALKSFIDRKNSILEDNWNDYRKNMLPGAVMPSSIKLNEKRKEEVIAAISGVRESLRSEIDPLINELLDDITEAPTEEAVRMLSIVKDRSNISADEIDYLMNKYGKNVQIYNALRDIAISHDYHDFLENKNMKQLTDLQRVESYLDNVTYMDIENDSLPDSTTMLALTYFEDATGIEPSAEE